MPRLCRNARNRSKSASGLSRSATVTMRPAVRGDPGAGGVPVARRAAARAPRPARPRGAAANSSLRPSSEPGEELLAGLRRQPEGLHPVPGVRPQPGRGAARRTRLGQVGADDPAQVAAQPLDAGPVAAGRPGRRPRRTAPGRDRQRQRPDQRASRPRTRARPGGRCRSVTVPPATRPAPLRRRRRSDAAAREQPLHDGDERQQRPAPRARRAGPRRGRRR